MAASSGCKARAGFTHCVKQVILGTAGPLKAASAALALALEEEEVTRISSNTVLVGTELGVEETADKTSSIGSCP